MSGPVDGAGLVPGDDVLVLAPGDGETAFAALGRIGDGWVFAVDADAAVLESLLRAAHERGAAGIAYLVGDAAVLPLPDGSVDAAIGRARPEAAGELYRVLRPGGRVSLELGADGASALAAAGFLDVTEAGAAVRAAVRR